MDAFDVIVIGSGPAGYIAAIRAAQLGLKTACIEKHSALGGTCLNVGCIPSKALLQSSELYTHILHRSAMHGIQAKATFDFSKIIERKNQVISGLNQGIQALFKKNQITRIKGKASFKTATILEVEGRELQAQNFVLATGSRSMSLPFLPFDEKKVLSSTGALALKAVPKTMVIIGAGIIGVELGSVYQRLGAQVSFVELMPNVCSVLDKSLCEGLRKMLTKQGMRFELSTKVISADVQDQEVVLTVEREDQTTSQISGDTVLVSIGRQPYTAGLGLENIGIETNAKGLISIDDNFRTSHPHIYAVGDIVSGPMLAHKAAEEGYAVAEIIAGHFPHVEYIAIPNVVYTCPEVGSVGLTEAEVTAMNIPFKIGQFPLKANARARCSGEEEGFVKMITCAQTGTLLGVHILSFHAGELIAQAALAIEKRATALDVGNTCYAHPTLSEAIKEAALTIYKKGIHL